MRKKIALFAVLFFVPIFVVAANTAAGQNGNGVANAQNSEAVTSSSSNAGSSSQSANSSSSSSSSSAGETTTTGQTQAENRVQTQTNNPGVGTMTQEQLETRITEQINESKPTYTAKNEKAGERSNAVANAAQELIRVSNRVENQGIGDQIREIAKIQNQNQDKVNQALDKAETRTGFAKFFIGANFKELTSAKKTMLENQNQIKELKKLMDSVITDADKLAISNQIITLQEQNLALRDQIEAESEGFSLFGWLNRWFNKF